MTLRLDDGRIVPARIKGKKLKPVCADRVVASPIDGEDDWLIESIVPRTNELSRPDSRGRREILASNLDTVVVVAALQPQPDWYVIDRYVAAAENIDAAAIVVLNKIDLPDEQHDTDALSDYRNCGYPVIASSAADGQGLDELAALLKDQTAIIVGQSGVGKSSIINELVQGARRETAEISGSTGEGRHTTVNSVMLDLPRGGRVIDSPGVRDFAPAIDSVDEVIRGFREISRTGEHCRFANCRHLQEPDCAVKAAVECGDISGRRYESYKRLFNIARDYVSRSTPRELR
jgi:ribosome biogenesis GTPase